MAVLGQPQGMMMAPMQGTATLPAALNYLASVDQLIVKQKKELLEILTGFETANKYEVYNNMKQQVLFVAEESNTCERQCCSTTRGLQLHCLDNGNLEVMLITREFAYCKGCCWCADGSCGFRMDVQAPVGNHIGYIRQRITIRVSDSFYPDQANVLSCLSADDTGRCVKTEQIYDKRDEHLFTIWGPCCICQDVCCPEDVDFPITTPNLQSRVGCVAKQWKGCCAEALTDADTFSVTFPMNLPLEQKCLMFGACFMVDYINFEGGGGGGGGA